MLKKRGTKEPQKKSSDARIANTKMTFGIALWHMKVIPRTMTGSVLTEKGAMTENDDERGEKDPA